MCVCVCVPIRFGDGECDSKQFWQRMVPTQDDTATGAIGADEMSCVVRERGFRFEDEQDDGLEGSALPAEKKVSSTRAKWRESGVPTRGAGIFAALCFQTFFPLALQPLRKIKKSPFGDAQPRQEPDPLSLSLSYCLPTLTSDTILKGPLHFPGTLRTGAPCELHVLAALHEALEPLR